MRTIDPLRARRQGRIRIAALQPGDAAAVMAMLGRCSTATLYHRFHGVTDGVFYAAQLLDHAADQDAYAAWSADTCVGLASLAVASDESTHIGVLVEDRWQQQGAGSALLAALLARARQRGLPALVADVLADNRFILPLLNRVGPTTTTFAYGGYRVHVGLDVRARDEAHAARSTRSHQENLE